MTNPSPTNLSARDYRRVAYHRHIVRTRTGSVVLSVTAVALVAAIVVAGVDTGHTASTVAAVAGAVSFGLLIVGGFVAFVGRFVIGDECRAMARFVVEAGGSSADLVRLATMNKNKRVDSYASDAEVLEYFARTTDLGPRLLAMTLDGTMVVQALRQYDTLRCSGTSCDPMRAPAVRAAANEALGAVLDHIGDDYAHLYGVAVLADACGVPTGDFAPSHR